MEIIRRISYTVGTLRWGVAAHIHMGCTVVNTEEIPGCSVKGKTIAKPGDGLFFT
jgi:hypothetical protein